MSGFKLRKKRSTSRVSIGRSIGRVSRTVGTTGRRHSHRSLGAGKPRRRLLEGVDQAKLARVLTVVAFVAVGMIGLWAILVSANSGSSEIKMTLAEADTSGVITPEGTAAPGVPTATIAIGGSVKLQAEVLEAAGKANNNFGNYLSDMNSVMLADVSIVNLLGSIGDGDAKAYPNGSYPAELAKALGEININSVVTANDQALIHGAQAFADSTDALSREGIDSLGVPTGDNTAYSVREINGIKIGMAAYNCATKKELDALVEKQKAAGLTDAEIKSRTNQLCIDVTEKKNGKSYSAASKAIVADVEAMRGEGAEFIVICLNWGTPGMEAPSDAMASLAQRLIEAGVDVTVGYGSERIGKITVKPVEDGKGGKKNCYVFYSLGCFFSDCDKGGTASKYESMALRFELTRPTDTLKIAAKVYPVYINRDPAHVSEDTHLKYLVVPAGKYVGLSERPPVFSTDALWNKCSSTFTHVREKISSLSKYLVLGDVDKYAPAQTQGGTGGTGGSGSNNL